ncbi:hypothetical protein KQ900_15360, partial [Listeria monocytogenes]|nr:hypothetical protein [Listeria monocytogenes]
ISGDIRSALAEGSTPSAHDRGKTARVGTSGRRTRRRGAAAFAGAGRQRRRTPSGEQPDRPPADRRLATGTEPSGTCIEQLPIRQG